MDGAEDELTKDISIHALRAEGDHHPERIAIPDSGISIHALRAEGDRRRSAPAPKRTYFNPRPPGGGRHDGYVGEPVLIVISIHALRAEGDEFLESMLDAGIISIHALRAEGDSRH